MTVSDGIESVQQIFALNVLNVNDSPEQSIATLSDGTEDQVYTIDLSTLYSDIDGDVLSFEISNLPDWLVQSGSTLSGTPEDKDTGTLELTVTADDGNGGTLQNVYELTVGNVNDAPEFASTPTQPIKENSSLKELLLDVSDVDTDFSNLTFTATSSDQAIIKDTDIKLSAVGGFLTITATPIIKQNGNVDITVTANDGSLTGNTVVSIIIESVNFLPEILLTEIPIATEDAVYSESILDGFTDIDDDVLVISLENAPAWLSVTDGVLSGTPTNDDVGTFDVIVNVSDGIGELVSKTLSITVENVNDLPEILLAEIPLATEDAIYSESILDGFTDVDNDALVITLENAPAWLDVTDGVLSGTPTNDDVGTFELIVNVSDGIGELVSKTLSITIENVNDAPIISQAALDVSVDQNNLYEYTIPSDVFSDVDEGDVLTLSIEDGYPSWLTLTGNTLSGTPGYDEIGTYTITITATDTDGLSITDTFDLEVQFVVYDAAFSATNVEVCEGELTTVEATGAIDYNWYDVDGTLLQTGGSSLEITAITSGQVVIEGKDDQDRTNPEKVTFDLSLNPSPEVPTVTEGDALSVPNDVALTYQWFLDDVMIEDSGATSASFTPEVTGEYYVVVTNSTGCSVESARVSFTATVAALSFNDFSLKMYPVPVNNELIVQSDLNLNDLRFDVTDVSGKLVPVQYIRNTNQVRFDTSKLSAGVYLMRVFQDDAIIVERFIKN